MSEAGFQVVVRFPEGVPVEAQGPAMLWFEHTLRLLTKMDVRVVKDLMGDDSRLRRFMTIEQRDKL